MRVRCHGRWSRWLDLPNALDHGPDWGAKANGTDPAWIGGARMFQLRTRGRPRGLRAHMVVAGRHGLNRAVASRRAQSGGPTIITRSQWGAASFKGSPGYGSVQMAYVHHTVSLNSYLEVRGARRGAGASSATPKLQSSNGWSDIGYNFLVDRFGQIYEGRAGGIDRAVIGAQAQGWNSVSTGIASVGTHTSTDVTPGVFNAIASIVGWKLSIHGVPDPGHGDPDLVGRRAPTATPPRPAGEASSASPATATAAPPAAPGDALYAQLPALRARAAGQSFDTGLSIRLPRQKRGPGQGRHGRDRPAGVPRRRTLPAGVGLEVQARTAQGWVTQGQTATAADGSWTTQVLLPYSRALRARDAPPTAPGAELRSPTVRLQVKPTIRTGHRRARTFAAALGRSSTGAPSPRARSRRSRSPSSAGSAAAGCASCASQRGRRRASSA